jgi:hypothetical protein
MIPITPHKATYVALRIVPEDTCHKIEVETGTQREKCSLKNPNDVIKKNYDTSLNPIAS